MREIGGRPIGTDQPLFVVAEIGLNHGGSVERALALVDAAAAAGASAIKLQTLAADRLVTGGAVAPQHLVHHSRDRSLVGLFRRWELDDAAHRLVVARARQHGLAVIATPLYLEAIALLESIGIDAYKIASGDLTWPALIEAAAHTGKPLIMSTGMSTLDEVAAAVDWARAAGARDVALLHCVSCYPVPEGSDNLRAIQTLASRFAVPVGLSDHGTDPATASLVVALGGVLYEKHIMLPGDFDAVDAAVSATPDQLAGIVQSAARAQRALGSGDKRCLPAERPNLVPSRRSLRAARDLPAGHTITSGDVVALRPGDGLGADRWHDLIGVVLRRPLAIHQPFDPEDLAGAR
jgi:sialic acid synthase SpsE